MRRSYRLCLNDLSCSPASGTLVALSTAIVIQLEVYQMSRTIGAAIGAVLMLLFFATLTSEHNRVLSMARATIGWQK
jgi:hypothetical protein